MIKDLVIENVRCFWGRHTFPLAPLTVLVGENSTGKSTLMAMIRVAASLMGGPPSLDFNEEPFQLGAYEQIATYRGGKGGRAKAFEVACRFSMSPRLAESLQLQNRSAILSGLFEPVRAQPVLKKWSFTWGPFSLAIFPGFKDDPVRFELKAPSGRASFTLKLPFRTEEIQMHVFWAATLYAMASETRLLAEQRAAATISDEDLKRFQDLLFDLPGQIGARPYALAPIRTRPKRTYDTLKETPEPEGSHVPFILSTLQASDSKAWAQLVSALEEFGRSSALFKTVEVRRLGKKISDPFQLQIKITGPSFNLVDVGYGVSQALPLLVECLRQPTGSTLLIQQPEVHLHPRAQAALASFLTALSKSQRKMFIVETHSDHSLDRLRMDARDRKGLAPEEIQILYLERGAKGVRSYPIDFDGHSNLVGAPAAYRKFFLDEEKRLLGLD